MRRAISSLFLAAGFILAAGSAAAQGLNSQGRSADCQLRIDTSSVNWVIRGYDPFAANEPVGSFDVLFVNEGNQECRFYPVFQADQNPFGLRSDAGRPVPYTLIDETDGYDATPLGGRTVRRISNPPVVVPPRGQQMVRYLLNVDADRLPGDGLYSQTLLLQAETGNGAPLAQRQMTVGIDVLPSAVMSLAGAFTRVNGRADVDLGELQEGIAKVPLQLNVRSTRGFRLGVESQNSGTLRLGATDWSIPYRLIVDGRNVPLTSATGFTSDSRPGRRADSMPIAFDIGSVDQKRAGVYSDVLTISIAVD